MQSQRNVNLSCKTCRKYDEELSRTTFPCTRANPLIPPARTQEDRKTRGRMDDVEKEKKKEEANKKMEHKFGIQFGKSLRNAFIA